MSSVRFQNVSIPKPLQGDVESIRIVEYSDNKGLAINVLPNGIPGIVFQHMSGQSAIDNITTPLGSTPVIQTLFLYGPGTKPSVMNYKAGSYTTIQIMLKPQALNSLLGLNASVLASGSVELNEFSPENLNEQLLEANDSQQQVLLLTNFLESRLNQVKNRDRLIEKGLGFINQNITSVQISSLSRFLHLSERHFERRFLQTVGISAKSYIRVKRFNEALRLMQSNQYAQLVEIAHTLNFHDQSHFIRDIKAFSGLTPSKLFHKVHNFHRAQKAYSYE